MDELLTYLSLLLIVYAFGRRYLWTSLPSIGALLRAIPWTPPQAEARAAARQAQRSAPAPLPIAPVVDTRYVARKHRAALRGMSRFVRNRRTDAEKIETLQRQNQQLKDETERLRQVNLKLRQVSAGQRAGIRDYLEREAQGKPISRKTVTKLLGKDTTLGYVAIGEVQEQLDRAAAAAANVVEFPAAGTPKPASLVQPTQQTA